MAEFVAQVDVDPAPVLVNWTTRRKYVINRPRICHAKQSRYTPSSFQSKQANDLYSSTLRIGSSVSSDGA